MDSSNSFLVFCGTNTMYLAKEICDYLNCPLGNMNVAHFADGEFAVSYEESIRGRDVFLVQSTFPSSDNLMELLLMIDAAKRASAKSVNAVVPYFGWARQDRKDKPRVSIGAKLVADMLSTAGIDRLITQSLKLDELVMAAPDVGGSKRASAYAKFLDVPLVLCQKTRTRANVVDDIRIIGDVQGKNVVIVDDIVDTAGTICKAGDVMMEAGAKSVRALASHCVMSGDAPVRVDNSQLEEIIFTNSIPYRNSIPCKKLKQLSVAQMFAETIRRVISNESISSQYLIK